MEKSKNGKKQRWEKTKVRKAKMGKIIGVKKQAKEHGGNTLLSDQYVLPLTKFIIYAAETFVFESPNLFMATGTDEMGQIMGSVG